MQYNRTSRCVPYSLAAEIKSLFSETMKQMIEIHISKLWFLVSPVGFDELYSVFFIISNRACHAFWRLQFQLLTFLNPADVLWINQEHVLSAGISDGFSQAPLLPAGSLASRTSRLRWHWACGGLTGPVGWRSWQSHRALLARVRRPSSAGSCGEGDETFRMSAAKRTL